MTIIPTKAGFHSLFTHLDIVVKFSLVQCCKCYLVLTPSAKVEREAT